MPKETDVPTRQLRRRNTTWTYIRMRALTRSFWTRPRTKNHLAAFMEVKRFRPEEIISKLRKAEATVRIATTATLLSSHKDSYTQQDMTADDPALPPGSSQAVATGRRSFFGD